MPIARVPDSVVFHPDLSPPDVLVYAALDCLATKGTCTVALAELAQRLRLSIDSVRRALHRLDVAGVITISEQRAANGGRKANVYHVPPVAAQPGEPLAGTAGPTTLTRVVENSPTGSSAARGSEAVGEPPTSGQLAKRVQVDWWEHVKKLTGRFPVSLHPAGFVRMLTPFFDAGYDVGAVKRAVAAVHGAGQTLTKASIERELTGGSGRQRRGTRTPIAALADLRFDEHGNLVP